MKIRKNIKTPHNTHKKGGFSKLYSTKSITLTYKTSEIKKGLEYEGTY